MSDITGQQLEWIVEEVAPTGYWLLHNQDTRLFLPNNNAPASLNAGDTITAISTHDEDNNPVADAMLPESPINTSMVLVAKDATARGAYFSWGMSRDLYVPKRWQESPVYPGMKYVVHTFIDENSGRITGATRLHKFYPETSEWLNEGQSVELTVFSKTDLGFKVLINKTVLGLLFHSDVSLDLKTGQTVDGIIRKRREDGKLNVGLKGESSGSRKDLHTAILEDLEAHGGMSTLTDKSTPQDIFKHFGVSKGAYKKAIGHLYKSKKISISRDCIQLIK